MPANNFVMQRYNTLRFRLMVVIGFIILFCQIISVCWLWHESKEQVGFMVEAALDNVDKQQHIDKEIREAVFSLAMPSVMMIVMTLALCYQAVTWIIRPLSALQSQLESRSENDLTLIKYQKSVIEIDAVAQAINRLIARLTTSLERERLFTADVAHELRTPLAGLRLHLELLEKKQHVTVRPLIHRLDQMTSSVSQLLQLARVGHSFASGNYQEVELKQDVILPMAQDMRSLLASRQQRLDIITNAGLNVRGDATLLRVLLRNLVENAHRYSPTGSVITIRGEALSEPVLIVEDQGPGIDESKSGELSNAFTRMDSRYGGIGLGLSIVTRIAQLHRAQFFLENRQTQSGSKAWVKFQKHQA